MREASARAPRLWACRSRHCRGRWLSWRPVSELEWLGDVSAFNLPPTAPKVQEHLGWVYWADEQYAAYGEPTDEQLPNLVENLNVLAQRMYFAPGVRNPGEGGLDVSFDLYGYLRPAPMAVNDEAPRG